MTKCDFCIKSNPSGKCYWIFQTARENDCRKAIELMTKTLQDKEYSEKKKRLI